MTIDQALAGIEEQYRLYIEIPQHSALNSIPRLVNALRIAVKCIREDADSWDLECERDQGKSGWHEALDKIQVALNGWE